MSLALLGWCLSTLTYQGALVLFLRVAHDMFTVHEGDEMWLPQICGNKICKAVKTNGKYMWEMPRLSSTTTARHVYYLRLSVLLYAFSTNIPKKLMLCYVYRMLLWSTKCPQWVSSFCSILLVSVLLVVLTLQMRRNFDTFCSCSTVVATMGGELEGLLSLGWCVVVTGSMGPYLYSCLGLHCHTLEEVVAI